MKFRVLVFDLDGTLVDSKIDFAAMRDELGLASQHDVLKTIATWDQTANAHAHTVIHRHEKLGAESSSLISGAKEFIDRVVRLKIPCAIFTRNSRETAVWSLNQHRLSYDFLVSREDGPPKPDPAGLHAVARRFQVDRNEILFVGDYLYDLQAGLQAGVSTALYLPLPADFDTSGAVFEFKSYAELAEWLF